MKGSNQILITRTALLLALTLVFQSIRIFIPIPPFLAVFVVGSLVNACLLIASQTVKLWSAVIISFIAPIVAYFQGQLPLWVFIIPVSFGNCIIVLLYNYLSKHGKLQAIILSSVAKAVFLYYGFYWMIILLNIPPKIAVSIMVVMSWPQVVTGIIGGLLSVSVSGRLNAIFSQNGK